ncbi:SDR family oxidoreductase [Nocardiopsis sp. NPDC101807]|uniref:SDR family oxidoreductase n=1 Tax=Nocardiopsis sp. NPDC101807 TaxID=3364339 RepID=UPI0037F4E771
MNQPILVTGATGSTGRHVVAGLIAEGVPVRALVRNPGAARLPEEVEVVRGDITDPAAVASAAEGTAAAYLLWPGFDGDGVEETVAALARHARRIVHLSASNVRDDRPAEENGVWGRVEAAVRAAAGEWTFLRVTGLATNTLMWADQVSGGVVRAPYGGASRSLVHEKDVAAAAVRALLDDGHTGRSYDITGPESLTQSDQVRIIGEETGVPVRWEEQPPEEAREEVARAMGDPDYADAALAHWAGLAAVPEPVGDGVREATGLPPRTYREWVRDHLADFTPAP